jgi:hypothetical protein
MGPPFPQLARVSSAITSSRPAAEPPFWWAVSGMCCARSVEQISAWGYLLEGIAFSHEGEVLALFHKYGPSLGWDLGQAFWQILPHAEICTQVFYGLPQKYQPL